MKTLETSIDIHAPIETVWRILTDFDNYASWNPFIRSFEGTPRVGESFKVTLQPPGGNPMRFNPTCLVLREDREFRWLGHLWIRGLFDGEHIFRLNEPVPGQTNLIHKEEFRGLLVPFLWKQLDTRTREGFHAMNHALKAQAETVTSQTTLP